MEVIEIKKTLIIMFDIILIMVLELFLNVIKHIKNNM